MYSFTIECSHKSGTYVFKNTSEKELSKGEKFLAIQRAAKSKNLAPENCKV